MLIAIALLGLMCGSFVNAYVWRVHEQSKLHARSKVAWKRRLSIVNGRSMCPHCKHELGARDLVPVLSWIVLKGRCQYCRDKISLQYPLVEITTMVVFIASYVFWPYDLNVYGGILLASWLVSSVLLMALVVYDVKWMLLPNRIVFPLTGVGVVHAISALVPKLSIVNVAMVVVSVLIAGGIFYVLYQVSKGTWIGGGDVKLGYALGLLLLNPWLSMLMIFIASLLGCLIAVILMLSKRASLATKIPFGPYLIAATIIAKLFGDAIMTAYTALIIA